MNHSVSVHFSEETRGTSSKVPAIGLIESLNVANRSRTERGQVNLSQKSDSCFEGVLGKPLVVCLQNLYFSYNRKEKLIQGLNVKITAGQIYALLGPSSCGKSTTFKLILGLLRPSKGQVLVYGGKPNTSLCPIPGPCAGYMPQELSLMPTMTIADHFNYYGRLSEMTTREIGKRAAYLRDLLRLPPFERPIEKLSGGQQRCTSLAVALLSSPSLLILDEPTVGIDPVLRNTIWNYFKELATTEGTTILLTTHYIEEARNANTIALMRDGALLAEANPGRLLSRFQMSSIEEVFLSLCEKEDKMLNESSTEMHPGKKKKKEKTPKKEDARCNAKKMCKRVSFAKSTGKRPHNGTFSWLRVWAILLDCFTLVNGKLMILLGTCLLPTLQILLFHLSIGKPVSRMPVSVSTPENRSLRFSDVFIDELQSRNVQVSVFKSSNASVGSVVDGFAFASFDFSKNFTRCLINRVRKGYQVSNYNLECSQVKMVSDHTNQFIIFQLALQLRDSFLASTRRFFPRLGYNPEALNVPVRVEEYVYGSEQFTFQEFMTPGMYMALVYLAPLIVTVFGFLEQQVCGHVERAQASGARPLEILVAHFICNSLLLIAQTGSMMAISLLYFETPNRGSLSLLLAIVYLEGLAGLSLALLMASLTKSKLLSIILIYSLPTSLWLICGVFWPIQNITIEMGRRGVILFPLTLPIETARNIMNRGWSWDQPGVLLGFGSTTVYTVVPLLLAYLAFK